MKLYVGHPSVLWCSVGLASPAECSTHLANIDQGQALSRPFQAEFSMAAYKEEMELDDINYSSRTNLTNGDVKRVGGCYVSTAVGFLMLLLVIAIAVGVGIIVHFAGGKQKVVCNCRSDGGQAGGETTTDPRSRLHQECMRLALEGDTEICEYL